MVESRPLKRRYFLILLAVTLVLLTLLVVSRPERRAELQPPAPPAVEVEQVEAWDLQPSMAVTGRLLPVRSTRLNFEVTGRVAARLVEAGQAVERGEVLLQLVDGDYRDADIQAEAGLEQERAAVARDRRLLKLAEENSRLQAREVGRLERLGSESLASRSKLGEAQQRLLQLQAEQARLQYSVETAEARLKLSEAERSRAARNLARTRLTAPFVGVVNQVLVEEGDYVSLNQEVLELVDLSMLEFYAEVPGHVAAALSTGREMALQVAGQSVSGELVAVQPSPDPQTHSHALRIRLPADNLLAGMLARVELPLPSLEGVLTVPVAAVLREEGRAYLFVVKEDRLQRREVELGLREAGRVVVRAGLGVGETVVARDVTALADGQQVEVLAEKAAEASGHS